MTEATRKLEEMVAQTQLLRDIKQDLDGIKTLLQHPAYVMQIDHPNREVADSLLKKITGRSFKPGEIIRLSTEEFQLYQDLLPCPPRNP